MLISKYLIYVFVYIKKHTRKGQYTLICLTCYNEYIAFHHKKKKSYRKITKKRQYHSGKNTDNGISQD